ncbi:MAG: hypothetical protein RML12_05335 [Xanthomonadales bacterium]|nr:hypothetical protein [Xanthomonadales bacterium]
MSATARSTGVKRTAGLNLWLLLLALAIIVLAANAYQTAVYNEQERQAIARTTELQVLSQQLAKSATEATTFLDVEGGESAFEPLRNLRSLDPEAGRRAQAWQRGRRDAGLRARARRRRPARPGGAPLGYDERQRRGDRIARERAPRAARREPRVQGRGDRLPGCARAVRAHAWCCAAARPTRSTTRRCP